MHAITHSSSSRSFGHTVSSQIKPLCKVSLKIMAISALFFVTCALLFSAPLAPVLMAVIAAPLTVEFLLRIVVQKGIVDTAIRYFERSRGARLLNSTKNTLRVVVPALVYGAASLALGLPLAISSLLTLQIIQLGMSYQRTNNFALSFFKHGLGNLFIFASVVNPIIMPFFIAKQIFDVHRIYNHEPTLEESLFNKIEQGFDRLFA